MPHSEHQIIDLDFHSLSNSEKRDTESFSFKVTDFIAEKLRMIVIKAQKLVPKQRFAFDIAVQHAKAVRRSFCSSSNKFPQPYYLIVHGDAGAGKSTLIHSISDWCEYYFKKPGDFVDMPYVVIKVCPHWCCCRFESRWNDDA